MKIGVYICQCGINIAATVDVERVAEQIGLQPNVVVSRFYKYMCSDPGQALIKKDIEAFKLDRVVVASCSPRMHEPTFRAVLEETGLNPYCFEMTNIREQCSWVHTDKEKATVKSIGLIKGAIARADLLEPLERKEVSVIPRALVVGGGISGIQAALEIANSGFKVYLVERSPSIGGRMAQLDKTFPTLDCSACILTPKMVDVARHPNIELLTYSEVVGVEGFIGNFNVQVRKKPRYIDMDKCNGCGSCVEVCPVDVKDEFNMDLGLRKAIYIPFPQAVPQKFTISKIGIARCVNACPAGVDVQGYVALISQKKFKEALALEREVNPFPSVCGRVCTHPCEQECSRGEFDEPIAIRALKRFIADQEIEQEKPELPLERKANIAVVGSGPAGLTCGYYLARQGYKVTVFETLPVIGGMLAVGIPDFRLPRDALKKDIDYIRDWGVEIKTNQTLGKDFTIDDLFAEGYKAVFLALGAHKERKLDIPGEESEGVLFCVDFLRKVNLKKDVKIGNKVAVIGGGEAAVDAARTARRLGAEEVSIVYRRSRVEMPADEKGILAAEEEGIKIEYLAAPVKILEKDGKVVGAECIKMELGSPDESGRRRPIPIEGSEFQIEVDTVIPAISQSPDLAWIKEEDRLKKTKWNTIMTDPKTFETSLSGVFAAGDAVTGPSSIIEAIAQAREVVVSIDRFLRGEDLKEGRMKQKIVAPVPEREVEKQPRVKIPTLPLEKRISSFEEVESAISEEMAVKEALRCLDCNICSMCKQCIEACEPKAIQHNMEEEMISLDVGTIVVATGFDLFNARTKPEYGYGKYDNVITGLEFERLVSASGPTGGHIEVNGKEPKKVVFIQCVGSRDKEGNEYCSRVCCMYTAKHAHQIRDKIPDAELTVYYTDIRAFGKGFEEFYNRVKGEDIVYRRRELDAPIQVVKQDDGVVVKAEGHPDTAADLVILATGLVPREDTKELARILNINQSADGFLLEAHPKLRPMDTFTDGIFLAGCCQSPKDIPDAVAQASGAAVKATTPLSQGKVVVEPISAVIEEELCSGCRVCEKLCAYSALAFDSEKKVMTINDVICKGCGSCASACPSGAISMKHFDTKQILAQLGGILS
ncbi:MAG: FAD-dependent oxidoreductase [Promethearchaeota archaeon]